MSAALWTTHGSASPLVRFPSPPPGQPKNAPTAAPYCTLPLFSPDHHTASSNSTSSAVPITPSPTTLPMVDEVQFELDDRPHAHSKSLPRYSPLPAARPPYMNNAPLPSAPQSLVVVDKKRFSHSSNAQFPQLSADDCALSVTMSATDSMSMTSGEKLDTFSSTTSFFFGIFIGLVPILSVCRWVHITFVVSPTPSMWDQRGLVYGRSVGLFMFVVLMVIILIAFLRLR